MADMNPPSWRSPIRSHACPICCGKSNACLKHLSPEQLIDKTKANQDETVDKAKELVDVRGQNSGDHKPKIIDSVSAFAHHVATRIS